MLKRELTVQSSMPMFELEEIMRTWANGQDAKVKRMGRLVRSYKTKGETMHWHISGNQKGMGTVEVSYLPTLGKLTVLVHDNRQGVWAGHSYEDLARVFVKHRKNIR